MEITNRFNKGINKDINKINFPTDNYYHLQNGRLLSDKGNTNFSISNIEGNSEFSNDVATLYPGFIIIGYINVREDVVFFLAEENNTGEGKIVLYKNISSTYIVILLYENEDIKFLPGYPIELDGVISRYESPEVIKIYWTDNNNTFRFLNIAPDVDKEGFSQADYTRVNNTELSKLELLSEVSFKTPVFNGFISGTLNSGMIQYAYRLYNLRGGETIFSPASELIPLTKYNSNNGSQRLRGQSTGGQAVDTDTGKGVNIKIELDDEVLDRFEKIEVVSLWYSDRNGIPTISIIDRKDTSSIIYINDEGGEAEYGTIELEEYQAIKNDFICKTIAEKDNRIFAGNITESYFDVNYDARAYRHNVNGISFIYSKDGLYRLNFELADSKWHEAILTSGDTYWGTYTDTGIIYITSEIPETFDCVNTFNLLEFDNIGNKFKYQEDGSTIGGDGENISYEFEEVTYNICSNVQTADGILDMNIPIDEGNRDWIYGSKKSYQRDEIYRFGIIFFDNKGRSSYTKWIGDIRIPSINDVGLTETTDVIKAKVLVPKFTVSNIPTLNGDILDYQIVSVKRNNEDKTIISQGVVGNSIWNSSESNENFFPTRITPVKDYEDRIPTNGGTDVNSVIFEYVSPDINFDNTFTIPLYKLNIEGVVSCPAHSHRGDSNSAFTYRTEYSGDLAYDDDIYDIKKYTDVNSLNLPLKLKVNILESFILIPSPEETGKVSFTSGTVVKHWCDRVNGTYPRKAGQKGTSGVLETDSLTGIGTYYGMTEDEASRSIFITNIKNEVIGYNGNTYEDRQLNTYIPASNINSGYCYYGDTFVCMFDYLRSIYDTGRGSNEKSVEIIYFPVETQYNLFFRHDDSFSRIYNYGEGAASTDEQFHINETGYTDLTKGVDWTPLYTEYYDEVYSKLDDSKIYFHKPIDYSNIEVYDTRIKYSNLKLNGEERDSWIQFLTNNYNEVNGKYGKINSLVEFNDTIFSFQETGISIAAINRQEVVSSNVGVATVIGSGGILDRFDYLSTEIGIQKRNKVIKSLQALYWLDLNKKKVYTYNRGIESLDDLKGLNSWFEYGLSANSIMKGIYDNKYTEVLMTFTNLIEEIETSVSYTVPTTTIQFEEVLAGNSITLTLNGVKYKFLASSTSNTGQFFKVENDLSDTIDNLQAAIERMGGSNYTVEKAGSSPYTLKITGAKYEVGNFFTETEDSTVASVNLGTSNSGADGIFVYDYSHVVLKNNSIFIADVSGHGYPDKFEILVNPVGPPNINGDWPGDTYVKVSSHYDGDIFGTIGGFETTAYTDVNSINVYQPWYIGTGNPGPGTPYPNNSTHSYISAHQPCPTMLDEFLADTGLDIPVNYNLVWGDGTGEGNLFEQRIWYSGLNPGDKVYLRVIGAAGTVWSSDIKIATSAKGGINVVAIQDVETITETYPVLYRTSILDATANGNIVNVEDVEYFNLRNNHKYSIGGVSNSKLEFTSPNSFSFNKTFTTGDIDISYYAKYKDNFTVAYNEAIKGFTGFYDFLPELYVKYNKGFLTTVDNKKLWKHNDGDYGQFYGEYFDSYIDVIVSNNSTRIKEYNNFEYYSEVYLDGQLVPNETLYSLQAENDYQQSEEVLLYPLSDDDDLKAGDDRYRLYTEGNNIPTTSPDFNILANIRRVIDHWRTNIPRDILEDAKIVSGDYNINDYDNDDYFIYRVLDSNGLIDYNRMRSPYLKLRLKYKNSENKKFLLHQVSTLIQSMIV